MSKETYTAWDNAEVLDDDTVIIEYLQAALEENDPELFVKAVGNVARAMGTTTVAQESELGRTSLYKHAEKHGKVTVPHPSSDLPIGTLKSIFRQAGWNWRRR